MAEASGGRSVPGLNPLAPTSWGVAESKGANLVSRVPERGWPIPLSAMICAPVGLKRPEEGSKWRLLGEYATWIQTAQRLFQYAVMARVTSHESQEANGRKLLPYINLRRESSSPNFCRNPENLYISATFPATYQPHVDYKRAGPASFPHQGIRLAHIRSRDHARAPTASCQINPGRTWPGCGPSSFCQPFLPD